MSRIFISYSSKDRDFILKFAQDLKDADHDVWLDKWNIIGREPYWDEIKAGIDSCTHFLYAISPEAVDRKGGAYIELSYAYGLPAKQRPVIVPIMVRATPFKDLPIQVNAGLLQIHDFTQRPYSDALMAVLKALQPSEETPATMPPPLPAPTTQTQPAPRAIPINRASIAVIVAAITILIALGAILASAGNNRSNPTATLTIGEVNPTNTPPQVVQGITATTQMPTVPTNITTTAPSVTPTTIPPTTHAPATATLPPTSTPTDEPNFETLAAATFTQEALGTFNAIASYTKTSTSTWTPSFSATPTSNRQFTLNAIVGVTRTANAIASYTKTPTPTWTPLSTSTPTRTWTPTFTSTPTMSPISVIPPGTTRKDAKGIEQVWVPAGCFMMGSDPTKDKNAQPDEQPQHEVCLTKGYWIDKYEVTNVAYQKFMDGGGYTNQEYWSLDGWKWLQSQPDKRPTDYDGFTDAQQPRVGVSWHEAEAYAKWRGGRLPTEAEWEYAARGSKSPIYPWGDMYENGRANIDETNAGGKYLKKTTSVGSYPTGVSWIGAYDMAGNAREWTADWYDENYYKQGVKNDPLRAASGLRHVLRGGSWINFQFDARSAYRDHNYPGNRFNYYGFRMVVGS